MRKPKTRGSRERRSRKANRYGLSRDIPELVKRLVRQECGFACVICGSLPVHYDHFRPEFKDARVHAADGIALLCADHHADKTAGRLANEDIARYRAAPYCGHADAKWPKFAWTTAGALQFGGISILTKSTSASLGVRVNGRPVIEVRPPELPGRPWELWGALSDRYGTVIIRLERNEVTLRQGSWDVTFEGQLLTVKRTAGELAASLRFDAGAHLIKVERLDMLLPNGHVMSGSATKLRISGPTHNFSLGSDCEDAEILGRVGLSAQRAAGWSNVSAGRVELSAFLHVTSGGGINVIGCEFEGPGDDAILDVGGVVL